MAELNADIILQGGQIPAQAQHQLAEGEQMAEGALAIGQEIQEQSDQKKLSSVMRAVNPNSPTYGQDLFAAAAKAGVSARTLVSLRQQMLAEQNQKLQSELIGINIKDKIMDMDDKSFDLFSKRNDKLNEGFGDTVASWDSTPEAQRQNPAFKAGMVTQRNQVYDDQIDLLRDYTLTHLVDGNKVKPDSKELSKQAQDQVIQAAAKRGDQAAQYYVSHAQALQKAKSMPFDIEATRDAFRKSAAAKQISEEKTKESTAAAEQKKAEAEKTRAEAYAKAVGMQGGGALPPDVTPQDVQVVAGALKKAGINVPGGFSGKALMTNTIPFIAATPRKDGEDIQSYAQRIAEEAVTGKTKLAGGLAYQRTVGTRGGAIEATVDTMVEEGGSVDQYVDTAKKLDFASLKPFKSAEQWMYDMTSDPALSDYALAANGLANEYAQVMARSGRGGVTDRQHALELLAGAKTPEQAETNARRVVAEARAAQRGTKTAAQGQGTDPNPNPKDKSTAKGGTVTRATLKAYAERENISEEEAAAHLKEHGITVKD